MWFVFVGVGLVLTIIGGLYTRRRLTSALAIVGVTPRPIRVMRWVSAWLLFGFPLVLIIAITVSALLGRATMPRFEGMASSWLLGVPFLWALLVMVQALPWLLVGEVVRFVFRRRPRTRRWHAIAVLGILGSFAIYTPARVIAQRGELRVRHHSVGSGSGEPFRIAYVADLQQDVHTDAERAARIIAPINASHADVVLSGGDWINSSPDFNAAAAASAGALHSRLGTFTVLGDHEHFAYFDRDRSVREIEAAMAARGVEMLDNQVRWFDHHGKKIAVAFLNYNYVTRAPAATVFALLAQLAGADYKILVTHQFDPALAQLVEDRVDLVLAAHTHGGQINPVVGLVHVPLARLETPYIDGRYQRGSTTIIVTAGVGYSLVPIRYASPGSVELIELRL